MQEKNKTNLPVFLIIYYACLIILNITVTYIQQISAVFKREYWYLFEHHSDIKYFIAEICTE